MFRRLLIANRGEIACRVARTARRLGIRCIAVYSDADANALHVAAADEAHRIGPPPARESYLDAEAILDAARRAGADAIHPGYGFLSENPDFAERCTARGIAFVGPPAAAIRAMGSKSEAKRLLAGTGVPLVPGYHGDDQAPERLAREADAAGWPVLVKAAAGGGGRGMRVVERAEDFGAALVGARREARAAFGDEKMLIERYVAKARHVEVQVFADRHGNFVHLFERDCSVQRRHQKVVEEAPAPGFGVGGGDGDEDGDRGEAGIGAGGKGGPRTAMCEAALAAARAIGYEGAGTVEFLLDRGGRFWFIEMNTRLQVEHPVTELVTGIDLVEWQLRAAAGEPLPLGQDALAVRGHAVEARLYAEDPGRGFLPSTGRLAHLRLPAAAGRDPAIRGTDPEREGPVPGDAGGVRVDTGVRAGDTVSMYYDPMLAKIVAWGPSRENALDRLAGALAATEVVGPVVNADFLRALVAHRRFRAGGVHTRFIEEHLDDLLSPPPPNPEREADAPEDEDLAVAAWAAAGAEDEKHGAAGGGEDPWSPWRRRDHWRLNGTGERIVRLRAGGEPYPVTVRAIGAAGGGAERAYRLHLPSGAETTIRGEPAGGGNGRWRLDVGGVSGRASVVRAGDRLVVFRGGRRREFEVHDPGAVSGGLEMAGGLTAPMPGRIVSVLVAPGESVREGQALVVLEAMKMEHTLAAPADGAVEEVRFAPGDLVDEAAELVVLAAPPPPG